MRLADTVLKAEGPLIGPSVVADMARLAGKISPTKCRAIVLDDESGVRFVMQSMLTQLGVESEGAVTCDEAIAKFKQSYFNIAFFDYRLPQGNGIECLLKARAMSPETNWVIWTGFADDPILTSMLDQFGFITLLRKPTSIDELKNLLHSFNY